MSFDLEEIVSLDEASINMTDDDVKKEETLFDKEDFQTDHTVPPGWSFKGVIASRKYFRLKCPLGNIYASRTHALGKRMKLFPKDGESREAKAISSISFTF